ncbi:DUF898 domain-containing protein [Bermanella marisrubri]|uniref:Transmembrane protein n=1 Tax=Bermanella marisrubri TaxID=207949 RepID=Q1N1C8_9GAMM|nr:YjgN family protein [Bermanella marisrubri]EAT12122.1 transmembrane protein [Oceanobacter sp. RED65] [Bermanella marisrubri]QIZ83585.1 DUF898 domain-containing protein [Bermanella marisrubri]
MDELTTPAAEQSGSIQSCQFQFKGDGTEYFKIWIVNILLTIVTFGIYSAWATVRNKRYFYSNLYIDNHNFRYLASPITILKGRLIAIAIFIAYSVISQMSPVLGLGLAICFLIAVPWIICRAQTFDRNMSAYRNIRFGFHGNYLEALMAYIVWPILGVLSLGILMPMAILKSHQFTIANTSYGTSRFDYKATYGDYGIIMLTLIGAGLMLWFVVWALQFMSLAPVSILVMIVGYFALMVYMSTSILNLMFNQTEIEEHRFVAQVPAVGFAKVLIINTFLTMITLGLYLPAAQVRMAKFVSENVELNVVGSLENFTAAQAQDSNALGDELGNVFDLGV